VGADNQGKTPAMRAQNKANPANVGQPGKKDEIQCPVHRGYCAWMVVAGQSNRPTSIPTISKKYKQDYIHEKTPSVINHAEIPFGLSEASLYFPHANRKNSQTNHESKPR
jgi:hypothetical protein